MHDCALRTIVSNAAQPSAGISLATEHDVHASTRILYTAKSQRTGSIHAGRHHEELAVFRKLVCLRKVPDRALRLVVAAAAENTGSGMVIQEFLRPLPDVSHKVHYPEWACPSGMRVYCVRSAHRAALVRGGARWGFPSFPQGLFRPSVPCAAYCPSPSCGRRFPAHAA